MKNVSDLRRAGRVWIALILTLLIAMIVVVLVAAQRDREMSSGAAASTSQQFSQTAPGTKTKVVVQVEKATGSATFSARLLEKQSERVYLRTSTPLTIRSDTSTKFVMGQPSDLRPTAVVHVTGTVGADRQLNAEQIAILTGYVEVR
ncbi:MAG TPA: hypothetical protein VKW78_16990 [Terriglobales bacterium]|nr:hypothetical protein [Terriglobales bacterium]